MKAFIKKVMGQKNWDRFVASVKYVKTLGHFFLYKGTKHQTFDGWHARRLFIKNKHVFFGYYDIQQFDKDEKKLLVLVVDRKARTNQDAAEIGYFNREEESFHQITTTKAWCWQQGSRLRWHPTRPDCIVFNDVENQCYVSKVYNLSSGMVEEILPYALYDFNHCFSYGLSSNFSRLQRLRPGYGYDVLPDETIGNKAPEEDGIFYVDIKNRTRYLLLSLRTLAMQNDPDLRYEHYINHISISPNGESFMFFHIFNMQEGGWQTRLCVYNLKENAYRILEDVDKVSHYDWRNDDELLVTCIKPNKQQYYALYRVSTGEKEILEHVGLTKDGHPSFYRSERMFISDTYPLENCQQHLFMFDMEKQQRKDLAVYYSTPLLYGEKRCDMHPRLSLSQNYITFDSTCSDNCRSIILLQRDEK